MTFEINFDEKEGKLVEDYMKVRNMNISEVARQAILEMIFDDDADLAAYNQAMEEYKKDPTTYTHEQVKKMLGLA